MSSGSSNVNVNMSALDIFTQFMETQQPEFSRRVERVRYRRPYSDAALADEKLSPLFKVDEDAKTACVLYNMLHKHQDNTYVAEMIPDILIIFAYSYLKSTTGTTIFLESVGNWQHMAVDDDIIKAVMAGKYDPQTSATDMAKEKKDTISSILEIIKDTGSNTELDPIPSECWTNASKHDTILSWIGAVSFNYLRMVINANTNIVNHTTSLDGKLPKFTQEFQDLYDINSSNVINADPKPFSPKVLDIISRRFQRQRGRATTLVLHASKLLNTATTPDSITRVLYAFGMLTVQEYGLPLLTWIRRLSKRFSVSDAELLSEMHAPSYSTSLMNVLTFMVNYTLPDDTYNKLPKSLQELGKPQHSMYWNVARMVDRGFHYQISLKYNENLFCLLTYMLLSLDDWEGNIYSTTGFDAPKRKGPYQRQIATDALAIVQYMSEKKRCI